MCTRRCVFGRVFSCVEACACVNARRLNTQGCLMCSCVRSFHLRKYLRCTKKIDEHISAYTPTHLYIYLHSCIHPCMHTCIHMRIHIHADIHAHSLSLSLSHTHTHTHTHTLNMYRLPVQGCSRCTTIFYQKI